METAIEGLSGRGEPAIGELAAPAGLDSSALPGADTADEAYPQRELVRNQPAAPSRVPIALRAALIMGEGGVRDDPAAQTWAMRSSLRPPDVGSRSGGSAGRDFGSIFTEHRAGQFPPHGIEQ